MIASTNPNRVTWISGSINVPGSPQDSDEGGYPYIDNNETPGCDSQGINCYPLEWLTTSEIYEKANITWQVYQDADNFDDNPFAWFKQFQNADKGSSLYERGFEGLSLDTFYAQAANGTLPEVSFIVGPSELSEHPPYSPRDGAWLQKQVVDAVTSSPKYSKTVLIISFDETGGFGDHVAPYHAPQGTPGEWIEDPFADMGEVFAGPGFRLPFYIISPWTRGGSVYAEHVDHNSQIKFIEKWQAAKGKNVTTGEMVPWRREHMGDLTDAFDFANPDYSIPSIPDAPAPHKNLLGEYDGAAHCEALYLVQRPPVPYASQVEDVSSLSEEGFKEVRGALTEGRFLVFEMNDVALANSGSGNITVSPATAGHESVEQRWVVHVEETGSNKFKITSAVDGQYLKSQGVLSPKIGGFYTVTFEAGKGYALQNKCGKYLVAGTDGVEYSPEIGYWKTYSVTYA